MTDDEFQDIVGLIVAGAFILMWVWLVGTLAWLWWEQL